MVLGASLLILRCSSQTGTKRSSLNWHFASNRDNIAASQQASRCKNINSCNPERRVSCLIGNRQN